TRAAVMLVAVALLGGACSGTADEDTLTISSPEATSPVVTAPPTTASTTTLPQTSTTAPQELPDRFGLADALAVDTGIDTGPASVSQQALVTNRLESITGLLRDFVIQTATVDDGDAIVLVAAPVPYLIGVPGLPGEIAGQLHSEATETIAVGGVTVTRAFSNERWWYYWASNSRLFAVVGDENVAEVALGAIVAGHDDPIWAAGDCLLFDPPQLAAMPNAPFGTDNIVDCDQPHTVEVSGAAILGDGPEAVFPSDEMGGKSRAFCDRAFDEYIGGSSRRSDLGQISYLPNEAEWLEGDRYLACIVFTQDAGGDPAVVDRPYAGAGAEFSIVPNVGDCYSGGSEAACTAIHDTDYLGSVDFPLDAYPPYSEAVEASNEACRSFANDTIIARDVPDARVFVFTIPLSAYEFEQGGQLDCYASILDGSGSRLAYRGSILDGTWSTVGPDDGGLEA
ncbi:MAG: hypothetical protein HKO87_03295, partial [Acidimicrobiia bacterium]|nr:hypothetical protein [Acidimicrobiia bacterium]